MSNPHDSLFRRAFGRTTNARDLLRSALPPSIARAIEWRSLRRIDGTFVDKRLRRYHTDLLFTARVGGRRVLLYVLFEHKANNDRITVLQVLGYLHAIATSKSGQDDLLSLFSYILQIGALPEERVATVLTDISPRSCKTMLTTAQQMARRINRENGPKWLARGRTQGQAALLLRQLQKKFGPLEREVVTRIRRARSAQLDHWADQFVNAVSLDDVFDK